MRKAILALALYAVAGVVSATPMLLIAHNQISGSGAVSTLIWNGANATFAGGLAVSAMASTATWDWNCTLSGSTCTGGTTLTSSGFFHTTSHIGSMASASTVLADVVVDLEITPNPSNPSGAGSATPVTQTPGTTGATSYQCNEGNFLAVVGANGCGNLSLGSNSQFDSALAYNVGGNANCVTRTIGGDDVSTGNPRGLFTAAASGGCEAVAGGFDLFTLAQKDETIGGKLILSNGVCRVFGSTCGGANWLTFQYVPVPAAGWLIAPAILAAARFARRRKAAR